MVGLTMTDFATIFLELEILALDHVGLLKLQFAGQALHLGHQVVAHLLGVAIQYLLDFIDILAIVLDVKQIPGNTLTILDVILQA